MSQAEREEDLRERQELRASNSFRTMDGETLLSQPLEAQPFLVSQLIPQGLHILGGAPKIGKSWLVLWMCLKIAMGEPIWNYETRQGTVLYLALEDSFERLQSRLLEITDEAPSCLHFAVLAKSISDGLDKQIESFIEEHPNTSFIAIDTLQNIRGEDNSANPYANDYKDLSVLKEIAYKHHIAIFLVHHLRKQKDIDPLNMLSGTTGLSGAVDTAFILDRAKRTETIATLFCSGRDIETVEIPIEFCEKEFIWKMREDDKTPIKMLDEVVMAVDNYFSSAVNKSFCGTATELAEMIKASGCLEITPAILSKRLLRYHAQFCNLGYTCEFGRTNQGRFIKIKVDCDRQCTTATSDGGDGKNDMELCVNSSVMLSPKA
ncbi:MAG: AAA family ATPase [Eubacteriales bacterium]|nr:AAA family ATPase [Eubacteriales bacterium]